MSNFEKINQDIYPPQQAHQSDSHENHHQSQYSNMDQSDPNIQKINPKKYQQTSKNLSFPSEYSSQEQRIDINQTQSLRDSENKHIIIFPKNTKNQKPQNNPDSKNPIQSTILQSYPWLNQKTLTIENPLIKLHNQIIDYYLAFQEQEETHNHNLFIFNKVQGILFKTFKNCDVLAPFLTNRVYLKNSEIQIFVLFDQSSLSNTQTIQKVRQCLQKINLSQIRFFEVNPQDNRQHKIGFNCLSPQKGYQIQIKMVTKQWISYLSMINDVLENNLQSKYLYLIFETIIRQRGMQNSVKGYFVFGLIAVFLSQRRRQRSRSLAENVLKFLEYFGIGPFTQRKISFIGKNEFEITLDSQQNNDTVGQFSFWIGPNIDISSHMAKQFFSILRNRYRLISNFNFSNSPSILAALINPGSETFRY